MNISFTSTDFNTNDNTAILWFDVDGDTYGVAYTGWTCDQSGDYNCMVSLLAEDGSAINDKDSQYVGISEALRSSAKEKLNDELTPDQLNSINASSI